MENQTMQAVGTSDDRMFGPRKAMVCGFAGALHDPFLNMLAGVGLKDLPVVFVADDRAGVRLKDIVEWPDRTGLHGNSTLEPAVILSGLTEKELHTVLAGYRSLKAPAPLWATLTEVSVQWTLSELLKELAAEREAFQ